MMSIIGWVGFVSGGIFGMLLALNEGGKAIRDLSLGRAMVWGMLSSAVYPLATQRANQVIWTCVFGAIVAIALVALARRAELRDLTHPRRLIEILLACLIIPVRDTVCPLNKPTN